jgi:hypothetical protein
MSKVSVETKKRNTFQCDCCKRELSVAHLSGAAIGFNVLGREIFIGLFCDYCHARCGLREALGFNEATRLKLLVHGIDETGDVYVEWDRVRQIMNEEKEAAIREGRWKPD